MTSVVQNHFACCNEVKCLKVHTAATHFVINLRDVFVICLSQVTSVEPSWADLHIDGFEKATYIDDYFSAASCYFQGDIQHAILRI